MNKIEKAEEIVLKFMRLQEPNYNWFNRNLATKCALIAVEEMLTLDNFSAEGRIYWVEVKSVLVNELLPKPIRHVV